jgi:hypothetical protein
VKNPPRSGNAASHASGNPAGGSASPASTRETTDPSQCARALSAHGIAGIYTATAARFALISVTATVTAWTNGHQIWCTCASAP